MAYLRQYQMAARMAPYGDPGLFSFVKKAVGGIVKGAGSILSSPIGSLAAGIALPGVGGLAVKGLGMLRAGRAGVQGIAAGRALIPAASRALVPAGGALAGRLGARLGARGIGKGLLTAGAGAAAGAGLAGLIEGGARKRYRRMNPLNPRALRRACRRINSAHAALTDIISIKKRVRCAPKRRGRCR